MTGLNITVTTASFEKATQHEGMLRTALLYGDNVMLFNPDLPYYLYILWTFDALFSKQDDKELLCHKVLSLTNSEYDILLGVAKELKKMKEPTHRDIIWAKIACEKYTSEFFNYAAKMSSSVATLFPLIKHNVIDFSRLARLMDFNTEERLGSFFKDLHSEAQCGKSFMMYDDMTSGFIHLPSINGNRLNLPEYVEEQIRHIAFVHSTLSQLPNFSNAKLEDIVQIRAELEAYLAKFRKAMLSYSKNIKHLPWDKHFSNEVSLLFIDEIAPAIAELRSVVEQNSFMKKLCTNIVNDKLMSVPVATSVGLPIVEGISAMILPMAEAVQIPSALIPTITTAGVVVGKNAVNSYNEFMAEKQVAEGNALYFYYRANKKMKKMRRAK